MKICSYLETYGSAEEKVVYQELGTSTIWLAGRSVENDISVSRTYYV